MPLSLYARSRNIMDVINNISGPSTASCYIALSSTAPNADGTGITEPSGNGYARCSMKYNLMSGTSEYVYNFPSSPTYDEGTDKYSISNILDIYFREATGPWGTLSYFAIFSASTGGELMAYGTLTSPINPIADTIPVIRVGGLVITEQ